MISCGDQRLYVVNHELEQLIRGLKARQAELYTKKQQASKVRVLLVDDSPALRAGMRVALEAVEKFSIVAETGTVTQALELIEKTTPDIVIASLYLPDARGTVISQKSAKQSSRMSVIFLGPADVNVCLVEAWKAGAIGFISKQVDVRQFVQFLEVASDGRYLWTATQLKRILEYYF